MRLTTIRELRGLTEDDQVLAIKARIVKVCKRKTGESAKYGAWSLQEIKLADPDNAAEFTYAKLKNRDLMGEDMIGSIILFEGFKSQGAWMGLSIKHEKCFDLGKEVNMLSVTAGASMELVEDNGPDGDQIPGEGPPDDPPSRPAAPAKTEQLKEPTQARSQQARNGSVLKEQRVRLMNLHRLCLQMATKNVSDWVTAQPMTPPLSMIEKLTEQGVATFFIQLARDGHHTQLSGANLIEFKILSGAKPATESGPSPDEQN